jgi:hypothetical protein
MREPLVGIEVCGYDKSENSCVRTVCGGISHHHYECIALGDASGGPCEPVNCCVTDVNGKCTLDLPPGDYLVISSDATRAVLPDLLGAVAGELLCGEVKQKHLRQIIRADGKKLPGKTRRRIGSDLLLVEPEFVEWTGAQELYSFIFESQGDWDATTTVLPPEGFLVDFDSLAEEVLSETEAIQFTITDIGSEWLPTEVRQRVKHRGHQEVILSRIGVKLSPRLAAQKGLDVHVRKLGRGKSQHPRAVVDPRAMLPVEVRGWVEPSAVDPEWILALRVNEASDVWLAITRGQGAVVHNLFGGWLSLGEYELPMPAKEDLFLAGRHFLTVVSNDKVVQRVALQEE